MAVQDYLPLVYDALRRVNEIGLWRILCRRSPMCCCWGTRGCENLLALMTLILTLENRLREKTGKMYPSCRKPTSTR